MPKPKALVLPSSTGTGPGPGPKPPIEPPPTDYNFKGFFEGVARRADGSAIAFGWTCIHESDAQLTIQFFCGQVSAGNECGITAIHPTETSEQAVTDQCQNSIPNRWQTLLPGSVISKFPGQALYAQATATLPDGQTTKNVSIIINPLGGSTKRVPYTDELLPGFPPDGPSAGKLKGYVDGIYPIDNNLYLVGWACLKNVYQNLKVKIFRSSNIQVAEVMTGSTAEEAVGQSCGTTENPQLMHRFAYKIPADMIQQFPGEPLTASLAEVPVGYSLQSSDYSLTVLGDNRLPGGGTDGMSDWIASRDFSSQQNNKQWSYEYSSGSQYFPMQWNSGTNRWESGTEPYLLLEMYSSHPGNNGDSVRTWTSNFAGSVKITATITDCDLGGGDGVKIIVRKNDQELWSGLLANKGAPISLDLSTAVGVGDKLRFVVNKGAANNWYDCTGFDPTIKRTSPPAPKPTPTPATNPPPPPAPPPAPLSPVPGPLKTIVAVVELDCGSKKTSQTSQCLITSSVYESFSFDIRLVKQYSPIKCIEKTNYSINVYDSDIGGLPLQLWMLQVSQGCQGHFEVTIKK